MTSTTHGSSFEYQSGLEWSVPSRWQPQLFADLTELQMYRAAKVEGSADPSTKEAKKAAMKARALHAGTTKTERLHAAIDAMIEQHRPQLVAWTGSDTSRAVWLTKLIYPDAKLDKSGKPSGWRTVYNHLNTLSL